MKIQQELLSRLKTAMLNRDPIRRDVLRFVKGKLDLMKPNLSDAEVHAVLRGLLKEAENVPTMFSDGEYAEITDLAKWAVEHGIVPAPLTKSEILDKLMADPGVIDKIRAVPEDKMLGPAMGVLKRTGFPVDTDDVRAVVINIRSAA